MGPAWGRTVRHLSAQTGTDRHASCPLTCTNGPAQHHPSQSGTLGVRLLIRGLGVQVPRGAHLLTCAFVLSGGSAESFSDGGGRGMVTRLRFAVPVDGGHQFRLLGDMSGRDSGSWATPVPVGVDASRSHVLFAPHPSWRNEPLRDSIRERPWWDLPGVLSETHPAVDLWSPWFSGGLTRPGNPPGGWFYYPRLGGRSTAGPEGEPGSSRPGVWSIK